MDPATFNLVQFVANVAVVPLVAALWGMHGRLSRIEGHLASISKSRIETIR